MYCLDAGILQEKTIPETPQQNGLAERCNRTLLEMAGCLLIDSGLPQDDVGSINSPCNKDQEFGCETRRRKMPSRSDARF